jgi:PAS domain S-box-containing protein
MLRETQSAMAPYVGFFYVYTTALVLLEVFLGAAFVIRSRAESSRKMALLAIAYAWSAPLVLLAMIAVPGVPPDLPGEPLQVAPALWLLGHIGWPLALIAFAFTPERAGTRAGRIVPIAFVAALAASGLLILAGVHLPVLITPDQRFTPLQRGGTVLVFLLDLIVLARLVRTRASARDAWLGAAVGFAVLDAALMLVAPVRFTTPFFLALTADVASAGAMLGALLADGFAVLRRATMQVAERERIAEVQALADAMPQVAWRMSGDGRNRYVNARWSEYSGRERIEGADPLFIDAVHPDDRAVRDEAFAAACAGDAPYEATFRLRRADGEYRYFLTRGVPIKHDGIITEWIGTCTDIEDRKQLEARQTTAYEREARDAGRMRALASIGRALSQSLDLDLVLATAVSAPVPHLADWALVNLLNADGDLIVAAVHHRDPERNERARRLIGNRYLIPGAKGGWMEVLANGGRGLLSVDLTDDLMRATTEPAWLDMLRQLEPRSSIVVPLYSGDVVRGTLSLVLAESGRSYQPDDLEMIEEIGRRVALAIENAEFYAREHRVADRLQRASLPASLPRVAGIVLDAVYQAGQSEAQIGGDWYDAFELDDGRLIVGVGDVMGSGLEAAVTMGAVRQAIRGAAEVHPDPVSILNAADRTLRKTQPDGLVTAFLGIIDPATGAIIYASAGHPPPFVRRADGAVERLTSGGVPLGLRGDAPPETVSVAHLEDDALLVLYTDGLTEAQRDIDVGEARLGAALGRIVTSEHPAEALRNDVLGNEAPEQRDDIAILTIRLTAARHRNVTDLDCDVRDGEAVRRVRRAVIDALQNAGLSEAALFDADLVLGELLGNVVRHAPPIANVRLDLSASAPVLCVLDRGPGCGNAPLLPDQQQEWGRGLYLASQLVSELAIESRAGGGTAIRATLHA